MIRVNGKSNLGVLAGMVDVREPRLFKIRRCKMQKIKMQKIKMQKPLGGVSLR